MNFCGAFVNNLLRIVRRTHYLTSISRSHCYRIKCGLALNSFRVLALNIGLDVLRKYKKGVKNCQKLLVLFFFVFGMTQRSEFNYYFIYIEMLEIIVLLLKGFLCNTTMKNSWYMSNCIFYCCKIVCVSRQLKD